MMSPPYNDHREVSEDPARDRNEMGGGEVSSRGPADEPRRRRSRRRLGSFEATTLAGGACASQLHIRKGAPTYCRERRRSVSKTNQRRSHGYRIRFAQSGHAIDCKRCGPDGGPSPCRSLFTATLSFFEGCLLGERTARRTQQHLRTIH